MVGAHLSIPAEVCMKWGLGGRSYFWGLASVLGRVVGGDVRGRDSKGRSGAHFSSANTHTGVWRTQGGKLLFLARQRERKKGEGKKIVERKDTRSI